jgi:DNA replication protein DnaC
MRFLAHDVEIGDPRFSKITPCPTCSGNLQQVYLQQLCGLSGAMLALRLVNTTRTADNAAALTAAERVIANPQYMLTLQGEPGVGKTHLLAVIVNEARHAGRTAVYTTTAELMDHLRSAYAPGSNVTFDGLLDKLTTCTVLCLDEFDRWSPTPWAQEKFFELVERRYRAGEQQLTCFATNAELADLPRYITSRLQDRRCQFVHLAGPDLRRL